MALGTAIVITLYCLANLAYLCTLTLAQIQNAPDDRVATLALNSMTAFAQRRRHHGRGHHHFHLRLQQRLDSRRLPRFLRDGKRRFVLPRDRKLNKHGVPGTALVFQGIWIAILIAARTRKPDGTYGNLYGDLLNYVVFSVLIFYALTIAGIFVLRRSARMLTVLQAFGYPIIPALYIVAASAIMLVLLLYQTQTALAGLVIVLLGLPVYWLWSRKGTPQQTQIDDFLCRAASLAPLQCLEPIWIPSRHSRAR